MKDMSGFINMLEMMDEVFFIGVSLDLMWVKILCPVCVKDAGFN